VSESDLSDLPFRELLRKLREYAEAGESEGAYLAHAEMLYRLGRLQGRAAGASPGSGLTHAVSILDGTST